MIDLDKKLLDAFQGYVVRKDIVRSVKGTANVPVFVLEYLLANGANINAADTKGCTALMRAAYIGYPSLVNLLLSHGADKEVKDNNGQMAIHYVRKECLADLKDILK